MVPTRKAIIICSPDQGEDHLPGTLTDVSNIRNFLTSPRGGSWRDNEVTLLYDPTLEEAFVTSNQSPVDYLL